MDLNTNISQQLQIITTGISALESRPAGGPPVPTGGTPDPVGSQPDPTGERAAGSGQWTADDWARWRNG
eukprot:5088147-Alexandrium_andersonii.AAC.1